MGEYSVIAFRIADITSRDQWRPPLPVRYGREVNQFLTKLWTPPVLVKVRPEFVGKELRLALVDGQPKSRAPYLASGTVLAGDFYWWPQAVAAELMRDGMKMYRESA